MLTRFLIIILLGFTSNFASAQIIGNDECQFAQYIPSISDYCSEPGAFTNVNANPDPVFANTCFLNWVNGVWFSFVPKEPSVQIQVFGDVNGIGTLQFPKIALFSDCNTFLQCSPGKDRGVDELTISGLVIGQLYYIMIESATGSEGTFQLCINDFISPPSPESDCEEAVILCDKSPFSIPNLNSAGSNTSEVNGSCIQEEFASSWYKWTCDISGTLTFDLIPNDFGINAITDDLDFAIYELPNGIDDCSGKSVIRCMASGANTFADGSIQPLANWAACNGITGLRDGETDATELPGCNDGSNNFASPLNMVSGRSYALVINNFSRSGLGFSIEFGGSGTFLGPTADFDVFAALAFECDKTIVFTNESASNADPIVSYTWNFGAGSSPSFASSEGPFDVLYESFGEKTAALTVESSRGCLVTKIVDLNIEPCCADTSTLALDALATDLICNGIPSGSILGQGISGAPQYSYSLDGINFQPNPLFPNLDDGDYELFVQDIKGCTDSLMLTLSEPPPLVVDAGMDTIVDLGFPAFLDSEFTPFGNVDILWTANTSTEGMECIDCPDPEVLAPGTTTYTILVTDEAGCTSLDEVTVRVNIIRPVYAPNVFSPNGDGRNDFFNVFAGPAAQSLDRLIVFDRWGNKVYEGAGSEVVLNDLQSGWDGSFNGQDVNPGVFVWLAEVLFIDGVVESITGDVTVVR